MVAKSTRTTYRQIAAALLVSFACVWAAVAYQISKARVEALASAQKETRNLARIVSEQFASHIDHIDILLQTLRREWIEGDGRFAEEGVTASDLLAPHAPARLYVYDVYGGLKYTFPQTAPQLDGNRLITKVDGAAADRLLINATHPQHQGDPAFINLARTLRRADGSTMGLICISVGGGNFIELYNALNLGAAGVITVGRADGTVLIRSKHIGSATDEPMRRAGLLGAEGNFVDHSPVDGKERLFSYRLVERLGLYVAVGYATNDLFASYFRQRAALMWGGVVCSAAFLLLAVVVLRNLVRAQRLTQLLSEGEARFRSLASLSASWYWEQDRNLRFTAVEGQDIPFSDIVGKTYEELPATFSEADKRAYTAAIEAREPFRDIEYEMTIDGKAQHFSICGLPVFDSESRFLGYRGTGRSITDRKAGEERMLYLSSYDSLTGLPNRALMEDRLTQVLAHADRTGSLVALLFVDLDHFKRVNDSLGHPVGDELLRGVGQRLLRIVRKSDTVCRLGGDEFIVLLTQVNTVNDIAHIATKITKALSEPHEIQNNRLYVSCSMGIAVHPMDGKTTADLLKNADAALYHAKQHGRNNFQFFTSEINARLADRLVLESDLRRALESGEFSLHYQKKIAAYSGELTGVEALIRWQHPTRGLLHPASFISVAEECGLIPRIGEWVLNEACRQNKSWQDDGLFQVPIAVNVSSLQFGQRSFIDFLDNALRKSCLPPQFLELELTESAVMKDGEESIAILRRLKDKGVQLTIDDFGTAYSSLNYLKRFPIDKVKIDRSFIADIVSDKIDFAIVGAIVTLAHSMGLKVVAEGVETAEQRELVSTHWCDELQGYLFGRPMDASQFERSVLHSGADA